MLTVSVGEGLLQKGEHILSTNVTYFAINKSFIIYFLLLCVCI